MLEELKHLKGLVEEKKARKQELLAKLDEEYGDIQKRYDAERDKIYHWMTQNGFPEHTDGTLGKIELRDSSPKYVIVEGREAELKRFLVANDLTDALEIKKQPINDLRKAGSIPDELVTTVTELELTITLAKDE